jgi:hypothetical protein
MGFSVTSFLLLQFGTVHLEIIAAGGAVDDPFADLVDDRGHAVAGGQRRADLEGSDWHREMSF